VANDDIYELEDSRTLAAPRVRRIKTPHLFDPEYASALKTAPLAAE
jgi:phytanoyl-CoA hydroxylase